MADEYYELLDWTVTSTTIICSSCKATDEIHDDYVDFFYQNGWRATISKCYCPDCAKKYLKPKKKTDAKRLRKTNG